MSKKKRKVRTQHEIASPTPPKPVEAIEVPAPAEMQPEIAPEPQRPAVVYAVRRPFVLPDGERVGSGVVIDEEAYGDRYWFAEPWLREVCGAGLLARVEWEANE